MLYWLFSIIIIFIRLQSQRHKYAFRENMPMEQLIQEVCDIKQSYTQIGGKFYEVIAR